VLISELSARSHLPVPTVKYYLREGLLPGGRATSATRATYDDSHLQRLRLIRALVEVAGLRLDQVRQVLAAVDDDSAPLHDTLGAALRAVGDAAKVDAAARSRVDAVIRRHGWHVSADSHNRDGLARALAALASLEHPISAGMLDRYFAAMHDLAEAEVASVPSETRDAAVRHAVIGTLLVEPVLTSIRRLAHEDVSARRFAPSEGIGPSPNV
jgi:DNA-binding transcriptional MerR regulator